MNDPAFPADVAAFSRNGCTSERGKLIETISARCTFDMKRDWRELATTVFDKPDTEVLRDVMDLYLSPEFRAFCEQARKRNLAPFELQRMIFKIIGYGLDGAQSFEADKLARVAQMMGGMSGMG